MKEASRPEGGELTMDGIVNSDHDVIAERSRGQLMDGTALSRSVFSEAFLFLGRVRPQGGRAVSSTWILLH